MVTVFVKPNGEPKANTSCPCLRLLAQSRQILLVDAQQRQIGQQVHAHQLGIDLGASWLHAIVAGGAFFRTPGQLHLNSPRAIDYVRVGDDVTFRVQDDT
jgi:hypothetical protein